MWVQVRHSEHHGGLLRRSHGNLRNFGVFLREGLDLQANLACHNPSCIGYAFSVFHTGRELSLISLATLLTS